MMISSYVTSDLLTKFLIWSSSAVLFFMVASFVQRLLVSYTERWQSRTLYAFKSWLKDAVEHNKTFVASDVPMRFRKVYYMVLTLEELDQEYEGEEWNHFKFGITENFLLPKARLMKSSPFQSQRHWALRCFRLMPIENDEKPILKLLKDRADAVRIESASVAVAIESDKLLGALFDRFANEA